MAKKKLGCKKGEISFQGKCYHKVMATPKYPIDWAEPTSETQQGCVMDPAHIAARCIIPSINEKNSIGKIFDTIIKESGKRQTQTIKFMPSGKEEKINYKNLGKDGNYERIMVCYWCQRI